MEEEPTKYTIVYDEWSCTNWGFVINEQWRGAERDDGVLLPEEDDELLDYVLAKLKEHVKKGYTDFKSVMDCFQTDDFVYDESSCDTCGHSGQKTIWKI
jgi:hypothetical protein